MHVSELTARFQEFIGCEVSVDGVLLVGADSRLVANENRPQEAAIILPHKQTSGRLLQVVPPWGGGRFIYAERATAVGILSDGPLQFASVRALVIRRDDAVFEFSDVA